MTFLAILLLVVAAAAVRARTRLAEGRKSAARTFLRVLLVGYCGIPMVVVAVALLLAPARTAAGFGFVAGSGPVASFLGVAYLGMALAATMASRFRGEYLVAAAIPWIVFLAGATVVHLHDLGGLHGSAVGAVGPVGVVHLLVVHGGVALLLTGALGASGLLGRTVDGG